MDQTSESTKVLLKQKYDEIIELLLTAGYFRARIHSLSEFDKVVGGLCWCITNSGEDVDVDILFQENSTIGQRIALAEAIVKALRKMNCPAQIQPHQIQGGVGGSDFPAIFPVIVWLVKKLFERRELREQQMRSFSVLQFSKNYQLPTECDKFTVSDSLSEILKRNKAVRQFKRVPQKGENEETRVHSCLMEYGELFGFGGGGGKGDKGSKATSSAATLGSEMIAIESTEAAGKTVIKLVVQDSADIHTGDNQPKKWGSFSSPDKGPGGGGGGSSSSTAGMSQFEKRLMQAQKDALKEEAGFEEAAKRMQDELMRGMTGAGDRSADNVVVVSGSSLSGLVGLSSEEMHSAAAAYEAEVEESRRRLEQQGQAQGAGAGATSAALGGAKLGPVAAFKRHKQALLKEQSYFQSHPKYRNYSSKCGTATLTRSLNLVLIQHIKECLPDIRNKVIGMMNDLNVSVCEYMYIVKG